ncbi:clathrin coat assembly protein ap19 [Jimgerdemannia flammicorona]|uniref:Clathrin coat assembly protein ap19 n=2 Tax=Jimgerdemannia flammicorona TaxID=994334 RepID=A0A433DDR2_9FUNG|nr:clathrin coat assembly protein ap19 [Jimgerdemannia flammicorona]RUS33404.1 clathrin coat assembly protein ap19 [Jimgerdemannia flammicorona]
MRPVTPLLCTSNPLRMIQYIIVFNRQGKVRLNRWFNAQSDKQKATTTREAVTMILTRKKTMATILEYHQYKLIFRRYASLYFAMAVDWTDNELNVLEIIHRYVQALDDYFGTVCELDVIYNFDKAYWILDEMIIGGELQETSRKAIISE